MRIYDSPIVSVLRGFHCITFVYNHVHCINVYMYMYIYKYMYMHVYTCTSLVYTSSIK